jgi:hypothetical protein
LLFYVYPNPYQNFTKGNKIELLVCKTGSQNCREHLSIINKCYIEATEYHLEKDYLNSIESLKSAFFNTTGLKEDSCIKCADLFRSTITKSIENINDELHKMTTGLIANNAYLKSYYASCDVLNDLKKEV